MIIGANAVVTKDIEQKGTYWAGIPAGKIKIMVLLIERGNYDA